ncbi:nucleoside 2-deoxyribosyltransferase [Ideonella dechloratans]|uniref:nucleoside 2-deoxyribosyltransferase n=1 Tax=Ideonella dechloratans TaxID=36863 RepID=UPI0035B16CCD
MHAPTVYLAGFDVFRPDAVSQGERLKACCAAQGWQGLYPLDNALPEGLQGLAAARWICEANLALIRRADAVLANLNHFRGAEPDSGTAFEVGFAVALGKPVVGYLDDGRTLREQLGGAQDADGLTVEDFGLPLNLMLACTAHLVVGDARAGLQALSYRFRNRP